MSDRSSRASLKFDARFNAITIQGTPKLGSETFADRVIGSAGRNPPNPSEIEQLEAPSLPPQTPPLKGGESPGLPRIRRHPRYKSARSAALWCAMGAVTFLGGCGAIRNKEGAAQPSADDAIERTADKGPVKLFVRVSPRQPRLSDLVAMDVRVESQPGVEIKSPAFGQAVGDFLIRDYSEPPPAAGSQTVRRYHYQLEPTHAGKHLIRSVSLEFVDKRANSERHGESVLIETDPLEVDVTSELGGKAPSLADLEPMVPPQPVPRTIAIGWLVAAGLALLTALVAVVVVLRRRKRRPVEPRRQTAEEIAHAALAQLLALDLPGRGLIKEFYLRLTGIVRQYVEDTTGIRAPEQTTEEFLRDMRARAVFPPERSVRLAEFLEAADLVKYAGQWPEQAQLEQAITRAHEFVNLKPSPAATMAAVGAA
jgi:hypothetical protein